MGNNYDYVYFVKDGQGNKIPIITGSTSDLQMVLWISEQEKETILPKYLAYKTLFIRVDGENFIVGEHP